MSRPAFRSYAQNLEDIVLWRALGTVSQGFYIDIGAHDPRRESVSRGFYEQGWRGIHVEPHPHLAARIRRDRPDEIVHEVALSDSEGTIRFTMTQVSGLSTGAQNYSEAYRQAGLVVAEQVVRTTTLARACASLAGRDVHWMKIDVEGMEEKVLRGWDPRSLRPWIIVIEATRPGSTQPAYGEWDQLILDGGYRFALFDGLNRFYVAAERPDLLPSLLAPANIHDLARGCELDASSPFVAAALRRQNATIATMRCSLSWRLTAPLRQLAALVSRSGDRDDL